MTTRTASIVFLVPPLRDARCAPSAEDIAIEDWDDLFRAAVERLAHVAVEKAVPAASGVQLQAPGTVLHECLEALDQLRRSVPPLRVQRLCRPARSEDERPTSGQVQAAT